LFSLYNAFKQYVDTSLSKEDFADAFSQTLGYSLFIAKLNQDTQEPIDLYNIQKFIPDNFTFIRALSDFLKELQKEEYLEVKHRVEEIIGMMNHLHLKSILKELAGESQLDLGESDPLISRDPFIYFYEHFLQEYDADKKRERGVYYTPPSVVHFIVRTINEILIDQFGIAAGLADHEQVEVLDFATGTGTFLHEAFHQILDIQHVQESPALRVKLVEDHLLKNFYGFEYLIAPYAIAHMKLSQFLRERQLHPKPELNILLTNTLDNSEEAQKSTQMPFVEWLRMEGHLANDIKAKPIRVIMGNPPYSGASKNKGSFDDTVKEEYRPADEGKMNWDVYEKFICFAHQKMKKINCGIIGVITNNNFLNAITKRQMRNALMRDFDRIYILNLHGKQGEVTDTGEADKNVFDITIGVAITFLVKTGKKDSDCEVFYASIKSPNQKQKWRQVLEFDLTKFKSLDVAGFNAEFAKTRWRGGFDQNLSLFVSSNDNVVSRLATYGGYWGISDIFNNFGSGFKTDRDPLTIDFDRKVLSKRMVKAFAGNYDSVFRETYNVKDSSSYNLL
jgi:predicted helicase